MAKSFQDMARQYERNRYSFSDFLGLPEQDAFYQYLKSNPSLPYRLFGGKQHCERLMLRIGSPETLGYEEPFPLVTLKIEPKNAKFSDDLSHRDILGALMHLGIERDTIGDIFLEGNTAYVFCTKAIAPFIEGQLERIKHTAVLVTQVTELPALQEQEPVQKKIQVASLRLDLLVAKTYNLSRQAAQDLLKAHKVFLDGRLQEGGSTEVQLGQIVSVRGFGRFSLLKEEGISKKGKHNLLLAVFA